eukprot:COSAG01_NODE_6776_length_3502_cov_32.970320_1_plen_105_part_00
MEGSRAAKKACVRRVPRARAKQRPVQVLMFIVFEGWQLRVGERREIEQGIASEICRSDYLSLPSETIPVPATVRGAAPHACGGGEARGGMGIGEVDRGCGANTG